MGRRLEWLNCGFSHRENPSFVSLLLIFDHSLERENATVRSPLVVESEISAVKKSLNLYFSVFRILPLYARDGI